MSIRYAASRISRRMRPGSGLLIWIVVTLAVAVRLFYVVDAADDPAAFEPLVDARTYDDLAAGLAGEGQLDETFLWQAAFYPFFLSAVYKVAGASILAAKLVQIILAGLTCLLSMRLGSRLFGDVAGLITGLIVALYGPLIFFDVQLLATGWTAFWVVALVSLAVDLGERPRLATAVLLGVAAALAILTRPTFVPVVAALTVWLVWGFRSETERGTGLRSLVAMALALGLVLGPYALAMRAATGHAGVIPPSGGINLHIGNNPDYERTINIRPGLAWEELLAEPQAHGRAPDPWSGQPWFLARVRDFVREHTAAAVGLLSRKATQLLSSRELPRTLDIYMHRTWSGLLSAAVFKVGPWGFPFGALLPLAAFGMLRSGARGAGPVFVVLVVFSASLVLVFVSARYRAPLVPMLAVLAGHGLVEAWRAVRERRTRRIAIATAVVLAVALVGTVPGPFAQEEVDLAAELHFGVGWNRYREQDWTEAAHHLRRAVELDRSLPAARNFLGITLANLGELEEAVAHFAEAVRLKPDYADAVNNLQVGRVRLAEVLLQTAVARAEANKYGEAVTAAERARDMADTAGRADLTERIESALAAFRAGRPWRP